MVLGSTGQVGSALLFVLRQHGVEPIGTGFTRGGDLTLDLGDAGAVRSALESSQPDLVLVVGAYTHVDGCEANPEQSRRVNFEGPAAAAGWASAHGARVVFYSTDYVFDGQAGPYAEEDPVHPLSRYGRDKRGAEEAVLALGDRGLVLRTAWVYSWEDPPRNFMQRLALNLAAGQSATIPDDQWGNPTFAGDLARATWDLLERGAAGVVHTAGEQAMTRYAFARLIAESFGLPADRINGVPTAALGQTAPRPLRAGMKVDRLRSLIGWVPRPPAAVLAELAALHPLEVRDP